MNLTTPQQHRPLISRSALPALIAFALSLIVFAITLRGTFIYDDYQVFNDDPRLHHPADWGKYWTESYNGGVDNLYRPLVSMTFALQTFFHGDKHAWPFHLVNWILHAVVAALVAETARRLILAGSPNDPHRANRIALIAGILFAVHPIHVEPIANVVGRAELMCAAGVFGAIVLLLHRPLTIRRAIAATACAVLAVLSKEQGLLIPLFISLLAWLIIRPPIWRSTDTSRERERQAWITLTLMLCWIFAGYIIFREHILKFSWDRAFLDTSINPLVKSGADHWLMPIAIAGRYAALLIAPLHLSPDYGGAVIGYQTHVGDPFVLIGFACITTFVLIDLVLWKMRRTLPDARAALFCLFAALLAYGMISNFLFLIGTNFGERLIYLPSAFLSLAAATGIARLPNKVLTPLAIVVVCAMSFKSITYAARWNDSATFYAWAASEQPKSVRLHMLIVADRLSRGDLDGAAAEATLGREALPDYDEIWIQSADVAAEQGHYDQARAWLNHALTLRASPKAIGRLTLLNGKGSASTSEPSTTKSSPTRIVR